MADITFYTNPMSRGQIARWALHEVGADYEQALLDYGTTMKAPEYLKFNPIGKVPCILDFRGTGDPKVVTEAAAICAYLAETYPAAGLAPTDDERADYYRWMFYAAGPVEQAVVSRSMGWEVTDDKQMMVGFGSFPKVMDALDGLLSDGRQFVCGDRFTMADVYFGSQIDWGLMFGSIDKRQSFEDYAARLRERDGYKAAKAVDGALIAEMQAAKG